MQPNDEPAAADVVIAEFMDADAVARLRERLAVRYDPELHRRPEELAAAVSGCRALVVRNRTRVDAALIGGAPRLGLVGRLGTGLDNIDVDACRQRGIAVVPAAGANSTAVAEYVVGALLVLIRGVYHATARVRAGDWPREGLIGGELAGRRLGLLGFGSTAREVALRARALGMTVTAHDPYVTPEDPAWTRLGVSPAPLRALLESSDAVSVHVALDAGTRGLLDRERLAMMKRGAVLVHAARGGVVDEAALADALREGRLGGAAVDVFEREPVSRGDVLAADLPNLLLTPHVAGVTVEANRRVSRCIADAVLSHLEPSP